MNLKDAERFFKNYDCSHLRMAQEQPSDYAAFKRFDLNKLEAQWRDEEIQRYSRLFCSTNIPKERLCGILVCLLNLIQDSCTQTAQKHLLNLFQSVKSIKDNLPANERLKLAQLLTGNLGNKNTSAIKMAYKTKDLALCQNYIALCLELLDDVTGAVAESTRKRCLNFEKEYMGWEYNTSRG
ncbi:MAG: hypothetical protein PHG02_05710 [Oscillospiraceae bacterium]|nr:hypothetical protein [Oscillospiraceae bacterium]